VATEIMGFQLLQWKAAIKLEKLGMKHSSGRSVRKHAAIALGMPPFCKCDEVLAKIQERINEIQAGG
jgi:hypothetical protein